MSMAQVAWSEQQVAELFELPFNDLLFRAQQIHRQHFPSDQVQLSTLLSVKTGTCPENCAYCPQSGHYKTFAEPHKLMPVEEVLARASAAKKNGATRFCIGGGWRSPPAKEMPKLMAMISELKKLGLETCGTFGMLDEEQARALQESGLDYYNHNLDTSPGYYQNIITTHTYQDRLDTIANLRKVGIKVCCGGIMGMGESRPDRIQFLLQLANMEQPPESVPLNRLIPVAGTPLEHAKPLDNIEFIRTVAVARVLLPKSMLRLSAGRAQMSEEMQALCFMAGINSIHYGEKLLVTGNPDQNQDLHMLEKLRMKPMPLTESTPACLT